MLETLSAIAQTVGKLILEVYNSKEFNIETKEDNSPLTIADMKSHNYISEQLRKYFPDIPIVSEEGRDIAYNNRKYWKRFFLVDPLDGTKEFIKQNGEFTVNIALIENGLPVIGVITVPAAIETYIGSVEDGAYKINSRGEKVKISVSNTSMNDKINVVQSRSHSGEEENNFYSNYKIKDRLSKGSSLKICLIAEGKAEIYFRSGPTWEWDTAAGHAILHAAGGYFVNKDKSELKYNKEILKHNGFIASSMKII